MESPDRIITLRARMFSEAPIAGTFVAAPTGPNMYRIVRVTSVRTAGDEASHRFRLTCQRFARADLPDGIEVLPWPRGPRPDPPSRPAIVQPAGSGRVRVSREAEEAARLARVARIGADDGVQNGRDHGPGIRLRAIRGRRNEIIREPDVVKEDGPDPDGPNRVVRRARRVDPLRALKRVGTLQDRDIDAVERLRGDLEAAEGTLLSPPVPCPQACTRRVTSESVSLIGRSTHRPRCAGRSLRSPRTILAWSSGLPAAARSAGSRGIATLATSWCHEGCKPASGNWPITIMAPSQVMIMDQSEPPRWPSDHEAVRSGHLLPLPAFAIHPVFPCHQLPVA